MKILLTGPTGFIGSAFTRLALAQGHQIAGLIIPAESIPATLPPSKTLSWFRGTLDDAPWKDIADFNPEVCVHTAWVTAPEVYLESQENLAFLNASVSFLRRVRELGADHIVSFGTCIEYKITGQALSEDTTPVEPTTTYSRSKNDLRLILEADAKSKNFTFCWGRVFYPYGPGEHPKRLCSSILDKLLRNEKIVLKTPNSTKDYIYIEDLARAVVTTIEQKFHGQINWGTGTSTTVRDIAQSLAKMIGKESLIEEVTPEQRDPLDFVVADATKLKSLGWKQAHSLQQGLEKIIASRAPR
jgi:nucleoside-diphosphate-sugar epimerase